MGLKKWLFSNMFLRNMLADFGGRSAYSKKPGNFIPYFQYRIGSFQQDYYLHFPKEPYIMQYENEIFNKLNEYKGYDIANYLNFHFDAYNDKHDFLRFLRYELADRLKRKIRKTHHQKLQSALEWITEKQQELQDKQQTEIKQEIEHDVRRMFINSHTNNKTEVENSVQELSQKLSGYIDKIMTDTEEKLSAITGQIPAGRIELNNRNHEEKIIQLLILLQQVQAPPELARAEQLFKKFTAMDIATILHLHFEAFRDNKIPTLQKKVGEQNERLKMNHPPVKKLVDALQTFFYG